MKKNIFVLFLCCVLLSCSSPGKRHSNVPREAYKAYSLGEKNAGGSKKDHERAIKEYSRAINIFPDYGLAYLKRADSYMAKGKEFYNQAISDYNEAIRINQIPGLLTHAHRRLGEIYESERNYPAAIIHYKNAGSYTNAQRLEVLLSKENQNRNAVQKETQKTANWNKRITENQHLYPAPFEGKWQLSLPEYITINDVKMKGNVVYEFTGKNYTYYLNGQIIRRGTFFYNSGRIELDEGTLLFYASNVVMLGNQPFVKQ